MEPTQSSKALVIYKRYFRLTPALYFCLFGLYGQEKITFHFDNVYRKTKISKSKKGAKTKFDCYNDKTKKIIEVKGASIPNDLSSWSPKPYFDLFYFVDFSSLDGKYNIYELKISSSSSDFLNVKNKEGKTNAQLMRSGRRPRFSIMEEFINKKIGCNGEPIVNGDLNE